MLLPTDRFDLIFAPLAGRRVQLTSGTGVNRGDQLLYAATRQLCSRFRVETVRSVADAEVCLLFAGGNVGPDARFERARQRRRHFMREAKAAGVECWLLPQSFTGPDATVDDCARVFVREQASLAYAPKRAELAPDLALGYDFPEQPLPEKIVAWLLRSDAESVMPEEIMGWSETDLGCSGTLEDYLRWATRAEHVYTDRLHVAITALACGREVTLLPNSYHKNASMHATWLAELGCEFENPT